MLGPTATEKRREEQGSRTSTRHAKASGSPIVSEENLSQTTTVSDRTRRVVHEKPCAGACERSERDEEVPTDTGHEV